LLQRLADDVIDLGFVEASPKQDGRNMIMVLAPHRNVKPRPRATETDEGAAQTQQQPQPADAE
jgi:translation initiation factor IF-3